MSQTYYYIIKNNKNQYFTRKKWTHEGWVDAIEEAEIIASATAIEEMSDVLSEIGDVLDQRTTAERVSVTVSEQGRGVRAETVDAKELREQSNALPSDYTRLDWTAAELESESASKKKGGKR